MVTLGVLRIGCGIAAQLVQMVVGLVPMWVLAVVHDAGYVAPRNAAGHA